MRAATATCGASGQSDAAACARLIRTTAAATRYMAATWRSLGWSYASTKGQRVRLRADELPRGRLIVHIYRHLVAVIDHVIHDTHDCGGAGRVRVEGYWTAPRLDEARLMDAPPPWRCFRG